MFKSIFLCFAFVLLFTVTAFAQCPPGYCPFPPKAVVKCDMCDKCNNGQCDKCINCNKLVLRHQMFLQPEYTLVPPVYGYIYQPPPVVVNVVPAPAFWVKTTRVPCHPIWNFFQPWRPVYAVPPMVGPIEPKGVSVQAPGVSVEVK